MKHRNPLAIVALSIITLGIYDLYWLSVTRKELNAKTRQKVPTLWLLVSPIVAFIVIFIIEVAASSASGSARADANIISVLLGIAAVVAILVVPMIWFYKFSKAVNEYTAGKMTTAVTFLVLWLFHLIGVALVQDAFNDMHGGPQAAGGPVTPQPPLGQPYYPNTPQEPPQQPVATNYNPAYQPANTTQPAPSVPQQLAPTENQTPPPSAPPVG